MNHSTNKRDYYWRLGASALSLAAALAAVSPGPVGATALYAGAAEIELRVNSVIDPFSDIITPDPLLESAGGGEASASIEVMRFDGPMVAAGTAATVVFNAEDLPRVTANAAISGDSSAGGFAESFAAIDYEALFAGRRGPVLDLVYSVDLGLSVDDLETESGEVGFLLSVSLGDELLRSVEGLLQDETGNERFEDVLQIGFGPDMTFDEFSALAVSFELFGSVVSLDDIALSEPMMALALPFGLLGLLAGRARSRRRVFG